MELEYTLNDAGWAKAVLIDDSGSYEMTVSYLHNTLHQLVIATSALFDGDDEAVVVFMDEPGEHQLLLKRIDHTYKFELRWFDDWASWDMFPKDKYRVITSGTFVLKDFGIKILQQLDAIYVEHGIDGYKSKWVEHEFSFNEYMKLKRIVSHIN